MEKVTVTFEQDGKKAVANMKIEGNKLNLKLDFEPSLDTKNNPPTPLYVFLALEFLKSLRKGGKNE